MLYEYLLPSDKHLFNSYLECWTEFVENYKLMCNDKGDFVIRLINPVSDAGEVVRLRSIATMFRQLSHERDICGFTPTLEVLKRVLNEAELSKQESQKRDTLFTYLDETKEKRWNRTFTVRQNPRNKQQTLPVNKILDIVHHEYIMHNRPLNKCYYKNEYPTLYSCPVVVDYILLLNERAHVMAILAKMIYHYKNGTLLELKIVDDL